VTAHGAVGPSAAGAFPTAADPALRLLVIASMVIIAGLAWAWTVALAAMPSCHTLPLPAFLGMWTVMMAAMMFPALIPVVLVYAMMARVRTRRPLLAATVFVAGYLVIWGLLGLPVHALLAAVGALVGSWPGLAATTGTIGGAVLIGCGVYQLTPLKDACLRHCRMPHLFLGHHWRNGITGALTLGIHHGLFCAGCCASIMLVLLVVGMMNMTWMVGLSAVIYLEKVLPAGRIVGRAVGVALCAAGLARIVA